MNGKLFHKLDFTRVLTKCNVWKQTNDIFFQKMMIIRYNFDRIGKGLFTEQFETLKTEIITKCVRKIV